MPSKIYPRRRGRGRKIRSKRKPQQVMIVRPRRSVGYTLSGFPKKKTVKLRYCQEITLNSAITGFDSHLFRANSAFDPDYTGTGHQPKGFDEWSTVYSHYTVMGSRMEVKILPSTTANVIPSVNGILLDTSTTGVAQFVNLPDLLESKLCGKNWHVGGSLYNGQNRNPGKYAMVKNFSSRKFFGIKDPQDGNSYSATTVANPTQQAYFVVWQYSIASNDPGILSYMVTIDYIIEFRDPLSLDRS